MHQQSLDAAGPEEVLLLMLEHRGACVNMQLYSTSELSRGIISRLLKQNEGKRPL